MNGILETILGFLRGSDKFIYNLIGIMALALSATVTFLIFLHILNIIRNWYSAGPLERKYQQWKRRIDFNAEHSVREEGRPRRLPMLDRAVARKAMIESCADADDSTKSRIRAAYEAFGFYRTDIRELRSLFWWKRMQAVVRLEHLRFAEAAGKVARLINDSNNDVRMAAVSMLAAVKHPALKDLLPELFEVNSRWSYKYLINVIYLAEIPAEHIEPFVFSEDKDRRKAAAILLGRRGSDESVAMLAVLSEDGVKDVRREAAKSLARAGAPGARAILFDMTMDKNPQIRAEAAKGLGAMGGDSTVPFLEKLALGESFEERYQAFKALAGLGEKGLASIRNLAERQPEMARQFLSAGSMERERQ